MNKWYHARVKTKKKKNDVPRNTEGWVMACEKGELRIVFRYHRVGFGNRHFKTISEKEAETLLTVTGASTDDPFLPWAGGVHIMRDF